MPPFSNRILKGEFTDKPVTFFFFRGEVVERVPVLKACCVCKQMTNCNSHLVRRIKCLNEFTGRIIKILESVITRQALSVGVRITF